MILYVNHHGFVAAVKHQGNEVIDLRYTPCRAMAMKFEPLPDKETTKVCRWIEHETKCNYDRLKY